MVTGKPFKEMSKEEQTSFLDERMKQSEKKYETLREQTKIAKEKRKNFKAYVHAGNDFMLKHEKAAEDGEVLAAIMWEFNPTQDNTFTGTILVYPTEWDDEMVTARVAYAIKAPTDTFKLNVAKGLCGARIQNEDADWSKEIQIPRYLYEKNLYMVQRAVSNMVSSEIILGVKHIPMRLKKAMFDKDMKEWRKTLANPDDAPEEAVSIEDAIAESK